MRRPIAAAALALVLLAVLSGCGGESAGDLFLLTRSGSTPGARLSMLVNEEGHVRCNGGPVHQLSDPLLVQARAIQEETIEAASKNLHLPPRPGSVLSYALRVEAGTITFSDNSAGEPAVLHRLSLFALQVAQQVCHLPE